MTKFITVTNDRGSKAVNVAHITTVDYDSGHTRITLGKKGIVIVNESFSEVMALINEETPTPAPIQGIDEWKAIMGGKDLEKIRAHVGKDIMFLGSDKWVWAKYLTARKNYELKYSRGNYYITIDSGDSELVIYKDSGSVLTGTGINRHSYFKFLNEGN